MTTGRTWQTPADPHRSLSIPTDSHRSPQFSTDPRRPPQIPTIFVWDLQAARAPSPLRTLWEIPLYQQALRQMPDQSHRYCLWLGWKGLRCSSAPWDISRYYRGREYVVSRGVIGRRVGFAGRYAGWWKEGGRGYRSVKWCSGKWRRWSSGKADKYWYHWVPLWSMSDSWQSIICICT